MFRLIVLVVLCLAGWKAYEAIERKKVAAAAPIAPFEVPSRATPTSTSTFSCDGRKYCSQMTSCAEATYFLRNCPRVKMDGNNDGVPCEQQWCR